MPSRSGDLSVETHGIAPVPAASRYGSARRLFTVWFAPQVNLTVVLVITFAVFAVKLLAGRQVLTAPSRRSHASSRRTLTEEKPRNATYTEKRTVPRLPG